MTESVESIPTRPPAPLSGIGDWRALRRRLEQAPRGDVWLTFEVPEVPLERLMAHPEASVFWAPAGRPGDDPRNTEPCVGIGHGRSITASGPERFARVRRELESWFAALSPVSLVASEEPSEFGESGGGPCPRAFGGFAFQPGDTESGDWRDFGEARFVLPRWLYQKTAHGPSSSLLLPERQRGQWEEMISEFGAWIASEARAAREGHSPATTALDSAALDSASISDWSARVRRVLDAIASGRFEKIVLARTTRLRFERELSVVDTLTALARSAATSTRFAFRAGDATFLGATPERLLYKRGALVASESLAGTFRAQPEGFGSELLRSPKEHEEHQPVLRTILERLRPHTSELTHPARPQLRELRDLMHLETPIWGRLKEPRHVLDLVTELHPTPAVGGVPSSEAMRWIRETEAAPRGWYAGPVGYCDANGDGEFCVALRSGLVRGDSALLYAGAGIVAGSDPESEYAETELKLRALSSALRAQSE